MTFRLEIIDYILIVSSLILSLSPGIYYGAVKKRNDSMEEYFLASREMSIFKISCSMFATIISSGIIIGMVVETYYYGILPMFSFFWFIPIQYVVAKLFIPVFYKTGSPDIFSYHELRFTKHLRSFLAVFTIIEKVFINSILIYSAATIWNTFTGIDIWAGSIATTLICIVYTSFGGVRGVTIADTIQSFFIVGSILTILFLGLCLVDGIWERNWQTGRLTILNFDFNPTIRHTFWSSTIGTFFFSTGALATSQINIMRILGSKSIVDCQKASMIGATLTIFIMFFSTLIGLLIYAVYYLCDPLSNKQISNSNELLSYFIGDKLSTYKGLPGVFLAGFTCAVVSTFSSALNGMSAVFMESVIRPLKVLKSEQWYTRIAKAVVVIHGSLSLSGVIFVQQFPNIYQALRMLLAVVDGPQLGLLLIGMLFPQASAKSAIGGICCGLVFMLWLLTGALLTKKKDSTLSLSTAECLTHNLSTFYNESSSSDWNSMNSNIRVPHLYNSTFNDTAIVDPKENTIYWGSFFPLSNVSFAWYSALGTTVTLLAFAIFTLLLGAEKKRKISYDLIPEPLQAFHKKLSKKWRKILLCDVYASPNNDKSTAEIQCELLENASDTT